MDRSTYYSTEQLRSFDLLWFERDALISVARLSQDFLGNSTAAVSGLAALADSPADLSFGIAAGRIYQNAQVDATTWGALGIDSNVVMQQGWTAAQVITLSTAGLSAGQSRWALVQADIGVEDAIRSGDPTGGVLYYYNSANPTQPFQGPGNSGTPNNTVREMVCSISVVLGNPATTGSEVPPNPTGSNVPLYLIDLTFGQTQITQMEILTAGPSVGVGVPSNYPQAPFLTGLLGTAPNAAGSHHGGIAGQAAKINLATETQGLLSSTSISGLNLFGYSQLKSVNDNSTPNTKRNITAAVVAVSGGGASAVLTGVSVSISSGTAGAGGLDTGTVAANTVYYEYIITKANGANQAGLMSLSSTAPTLPSTYTMFRRVTGAAITDASVHFYAIEQQNALAHYVGSFPGIASGATSGFTAVSVALFTAATAISILVQLGVTAGPSAFAAVAASTTGNTIAGITQPSADASNINLFADVPIETTSQIAWSSNSTNTLSLIGWEDAA